ncbi:unnamed protein product [Angiostrongylus costaricensis]|uniref:Nucleotid_trans domain-containing protein n=1 Tax=Angiostrongylus costaricensis TaxID=334426 RepID=A0A158PI50_ANGCS|nr:unnamed protein product [Angiostrongylus costaricensis]
MENVQAIPLFPRWQRIGRLIANVDHYGKFKSIPNDLENRRYVVYQLVHMLRSHIAAVLSSRGISFWSMQQDSVWTENFVSMEVEKHYPNALLIFDTVGNDQFAVYKRSIPGWICGATFFVRASPVTVEFFKKIDHVSKLSKMELFRRENFIFINNDGTCNASAVLRVKETVAAALNEVRKEPVDDVEVSTLDHLLWCIHRWMGFDPYYNKRFLRVHESIV